ncbi:hypothetical protein BT96DRAFT_960623 [Gymnopus androsaceus JB14]|uniref:Uncharacterized protein n=1 Tax=Gymnopus androsaceus JB14 TaxID=1447944 RepID=A0A6A4GLS2_9AGAR|nr:hypothetical protein BT96DRAFT_960623 [Gymnopus androsaceus JB14]
MLRSSPKLHGFDIPGVPEKVIASLFADDTSVYLSEQDKYTDLTDVLETWCKASMPLGEKEYRDRLVLTRKLNPDDEPIPMTIQINPDGTTTRILGARIGNNADAVEPWLPIIERIETILEQCTDQYPTMEYLTTANGMPTINTTGNKTDQESRVNTFIQTWRPRTHKLPPKLSNSKCLYGITLVQTLLNGR